MVESVGCRLCWLVVGCRSEERAVQKAAGIRGVGDMAALLQSAPKPVIEVLRINTVIRSISNHLVSTRGRLHGRCLHGCCMHGCCLLWVLLAWVVLAWAQLHGRCLLWVVLVVDASTVVAPPPDQLFSHVPAVIM